MVDTADKLGGSLLDARRTGRSCCASSHTVRARPGVLAGLAGALRARRDRRSLQRLAPDFAGFRSAVCGRRTGRRARPARLRRLREAIDCASVECP